MSLLMMHPHRRRPVFVPPVTYSGPGPGIYTRNITIGGIYAGTYPFKVRIPTGYSNSTPCPVMLCLGAASARGTDGTSMMSDTLLASIDTLGFPVICIYGQWQATGTHGGREAFIPSIDITNPTSWFNVVASEWNCDPHKRLGTAWSLGALFMWEALWANPGLFAGIMIAEGYVNQAAMTFWGATVSPATNTQAATVVAQAAPLTGVIHHQNNDDGTNTDALATSARDGYVAAGHSNYSYVPHLTGGHDPGNMLAASGATYYTNGLFLMSR